MSRKTFLSTITVKKNLNKFKMFESLQIAEKSHLVTVTIHVK